MLRRGRLRGWGVARHLFILSQTCLSCALNSSVLVIIIQSFRELCTSGQLVLDLWELANRRNRPAWRQSPCPNCHYNHHPCNTSPQLTHDGLKITGMCDHYRLSTTLPNPKQEIPAVFASATSPVPSNWALAGVDILSK